MPLYVGFIITLVCLTLFSYKKFNSIHNIELLKQQTEENLTEQSDTANAVDFNNKAVLPKLEDLYNQNQDLAGWISIPGTGIDYPIMYLSNDNDYYLSHDFYKEEDKNGLLVLDKRCDASGDDVNWLIHGHNMKSGDMFGELDYYSDESYYKAHPIIQLCTLTEERDYEIIAVFKTSVSDKDNGDFPYYHYIQIANQNLYNDYISAAKDIALYDTGKDAVYPEKLITLSTCEYTKVDGRFVVLGRLINE